MNNQTVLNCQMRVRLFRIPGAVLLNSNEVGSGNDEKCKDVGCGLPEGGEGCVNSETLKKLTMVTKNGQWRD